MRNYIPFISSVFGCAALFITDYFAGSEIHWQRNIIVSIFMLAVLLLINKSARPAHKA